MLEWWLVSATNAVVGIFLDAGSALLAAEQADSVMPGGAPHAVQAMYFVPLPDDG